MINVFQNRSEIKNATRENSMCKYAVLCTPVRGILVVLLLIVVIVAVAGVFVDIVDIVEVVGVVIVVVAVLVLVLALTSTIKLRI